MIEASMDRGWRTVAAAVSAIALAACGTGDATVGGDDAGSAADGQWTASLAPVSESGVQGTVRVTPGGDSLTVKLELLGVAEGQRYPSRLVAAACGADGSTVAELQTPHVGTVGVGSSLTRIGPDAISQDGGLSVRVDRPDGSPAACGDLRPGGV